MTTDAEINKGEFMGDIQELNKLIDSLNPLSHDTPLIDALRKISGILEREGKHTDKYQPPTVLWELETGDRKIKLCKAKGSPPTWDGYYIEFTVLRDNGRDFRYSQPLSHTDVTALWRALDKSLAGVME